MNELGVAGYFVAFLAIAVLAYPLLDGETKRRGRSVTRGFARLQKEHGLRGKFRFAFDEVHHGWQGHNYQRADDADWTRYTQVGGKLVAEAVELSRRMFWTGRRIGVVGISIALVAASLGILSAMS